MYGYVKYPEISQEKKTQTRLRCSQCATEGKLVYAGLKRTCAEDVFLSCGWAACTPLYYFLHTTACTHSTCARFIVMQCFCIVPGSCLKHENNGTLSLLKCFQWTDSLKLRTPQRIARSQLGQSPNNLQRMLAHPEGKSFQTFPWDPRTMISHKWSVAELSYNLAADACAQRKLLMPWFCWTLYLLELHLSTPRQNYDPHPAAFWYKPSRNEHQHITM